MMNANLALIMVVLTVACNMPTQDTSTGETAAGNCQFDSTDSSDEFDVAILDGRVMDPECEFGGIRNVGIRDGRIASITTGEISGDESIDATGLVVARSA